MIIVETGQLWLTDIFLGHSLHQDISDLYDDSVMDEPYRLEMSEKLGTA